MIRKYLVGIHYQQNMQLFGIDHVLQSLMHCN